MLFAIYGLLFGSMVLAGVASYGQAREKVNQYLDRQIREAGFHLEDMFLDLSVHRLKMLHGGAPVGLGLLGWLLTGLWPIGLMGVGVGFLVPRMVIKNLHKRRAKMFHKQLVDCLLLLSSCLRAGLSMMQSFNVVSEEMPAPISQEFGLVLKESRMGVALDETMEHFKQRMPSDDSNLFVTAVLVARQTGGDVTAIFARLIDTLRERNKIREKIATLTFMSKMQGAIMGCLPVFFSLAVYSMDRSHFDFFIQDPDGRLMLAMVVMAQIFGAFLFIRFSKSPL